ncbi:unnamed protein product [marine sediment metagenome]|uniref:Uncharacterized protein n=1 Tax=marine sediment metagenome TaxID=412755 RepID=X0UTK3_9ZZZZ
MTRKDIWEDIEKIKESLKSLYRVVDKLEEAAQRPKSEKLEIDQYGKYFSRDEIDAQCIKLSVALNTCAEATRGLSKKMRGIKL